jgi:aldehyde:ferredoxin oxidoreductase
MVTTARYVKELHPEARVTFIGPCAAKELEFADLEKTTSFDDATAAGRGYGVAGGVAGSGTIIPINKAAAVLQTFKQSSSNKLPQK